MVSHQPTDAPVTGRTKNVRNEIDQAITKLNNNIRETKNLETDGVKFDDPHVDTAQDNIRDTIREIFGVDSPEYYDHSQHKIWHGGHIYLESRDKRQEKFIAGIPHTIHMLEGLISRLEERRRVLRSKTPAATGDRTTTAATKQILHEAPLVETAELPRHITTHRICVVHGQNEALKNAVTEFLKKLGLEPVVLHTQKTSDRNIVEKIESMPEVDYAVVLLTADDFVQPGKPMRNSKPHLSRNVLFELGYYVGRLGKSRVCALYKGNGKLPADYAGVECVSINESQVWRRLLGLELKAAGLELNIKSSG